MKIKVMDLRSEGKGYILVVDVFADDLERVPEHFQNLPARDKSYSLEEAEAHKAFGLMAWLMWPRGAGATEERS